MTLPYPPIGEYFLLGKALKSHGTAGQLRVMTEPKFKRYFRKGTFIFFDHDGSKVPYQLLAVEEDAHFIISLDGVEKEKSDTLANKEIWIPLDQITVQHQNAPKNLVDEWADYFILDQSTLQTYSILRTEELPQQLMAIIAIKGKEIYIPLNDQFISKIDRREKIIYMQIPEGLLDL